MVILLREVGVPARIVNGFVGGEWNRHGEFYLVRESDAHSWAEVYFPSYGWVIFDATPEADSGFHEARTSFALSYIDYLRFRWQRYVVDFSQKDQIRLLYGFEHSLRRQSVKLSNIRSIKPSFDKGSITLLALALIGLWLFVKKPRFLPVMGGARKRNSNKASVLYGDALKLLSKKGYSKPPSMTPGEFSQYVVSEGGEAYLPFRRITDKYLSIRFGERNTRRDIDELRQMVLEFRKNCR